MSGGKRKQAPELFDPLAVPSTARNLRTSYRCTVTSCPITVSTSRPVPPPVDYFYAENEIYDDYVPSNPITAESLGIKEKGVKVRNSNSVCTQLLPFAAITNLYRVGLSSANVEGLLKHSLR